MAKAAVGRDLDDVPTGGRTDKKRPEDIVEMYPFPDKKWVTLRLHGPVYSYGVHWVSTTKKDGGATRFLTECARFDLSTGQRDSSKYCPWCEFGEVKGADDKAIVQFATNNYANAIIRKLQQDAPSEPDAPTKKEARTGIKDKESDTWTPNRVVRLTGSLIKLLKELKQLNTVEDEEGNTKAYSVLDPKYGRDIKVYFDKSKSPASQYQVQMGDSKPLKKSERAYLVWDLTGLHEAPEDMAEVQRDFDSWAERNGHKKASKKKARDEDSDDDLDDEDEAPRKSKKTKRPVDDLDDDDDVPAKKPKKVVDDDDDDDGDDDDDLPPPKSKGKKKPAVDEDDDDDAPPSKSKKVAKKAADEDEDEDDDPPPRSKAKASKSRDEDEDEDEDDDPPPKAKAKKKPPVDDDEDEDDDPPPKSKKVAKKAVDEDEDDDEPPVKSTKKSAKRVADDDEEDDDDPPPTKSAKKAKKAKDDEFDDLD